MLNNSIFIYALNIIIFERYSFTTSAVCAYKLRKELVRDQISEKLFELQEFDEATNQVHIISHEILHGCLFICTLEVQAFIKMTDI